jgi:hypothetical protein
MRCPSRNKNSVSFALRVGISNNPILFVEPLPKLGIQENVLVMYWVSVWFQPLSILQCNLKITRQVKNGFIE